MTSTRVTNALKDRPFVYYIQSGKRAKPMTSGADPFDPHMAIPLVEILMVENTQMDGYVKPEDRKAWWDPRR